MGAKIHNERLLGVGFSALLSFLDDLGVPGEAFGEALGRILAEKFESKKSRKKDQQGGCLGGTREPRKGKVWLG